MSRTRLAALIGPALAGALALAACSGGSAAIADPTATPPALEAAAPTPTATATPAPAPTPTPRRTPTGGLLFKPTRVEPGGVAIIYLDADATSATAKFQGRQYPMLHQDNGWWTIVGVGAGLELGLYPVSVTYAPAGGETFVSVVASLAVTERVFPVVRIDLDPGSSSLLSQEIVQAERAKRAAIFSGFTAQRLWSGPFMAPTAGAMSSIYGEGRSYNGGPVTDYHRGTDYVGDIGSPVVAAAAGQVAFTGALRVRGNSIMIDHGAGVFTAYHHLSSIDVIEDQIVSAGETIGAVGSTGVATGPHLHWEVVVRGVEVDGEVWLSGDEIAP